MGGRKMKQQFIKQISYMCILLLACVLLVACVSKQAQTKKVVEYFRLSAAKIEPQLITAEGSTLIIEYEEVIPFEGGDLNLAVQTKEWVSEEEKRKYSTSTHVMTGRTRTTFYVKDDVAIPTGYAWKKYKMSDGKIQCCITDDKKLKGLQTIMIYLSQNYKRVSNPVTVRGDFQE
jgi:hypothetical protein